MAFSCLILLLALAATFCRGDKPLALVANPDDLLTCIGLAKDVLQEEARLVECDKHTAFWRTGWSASKTWGQLHFGGVGLCAVIDTGSGSESASLSAANCHVAQQKAVLWRWDEGYRIQVLENGYKSEPGKALCVMRPEGSAVGTRVQLQACSSNRSQEWLLLPRGTEDPNKGLDELELPLYASGRFIVDSEGYRVRMRGVNWYGAHMEQKVNNGLDQQPLEKLAKLIRHLGFNTVRLNYAVQMWFEHKQGVIVNSDFLTANPQLQNKTSLEVFDAVVDALTGQGLLVVVCCHTSDFRWCCGLHDDQSLWYNSRWSERAWLDSLTGLSQRYAHNFRVIGYDIRNEPRPNVPTGKGGRNPILIWWNTKVWGNCSELSVKGWHLPRITIGSLSQAGICLGQHTADWREAATQGAFAVWHGNPEALVFVEGVGAADLQLVEKYPMKFKQGCLKQKLVWSVHDYNWFWRWLRLGEVLHHGGSSFPEILLTLQGIYKNSDQRSGWSTFRKDRERAWSYLLEKGAAPVWIGEFGAGGNTTWWWNFIQYARDLDLDWCYWSLDAYKYQPGVIIGSDYMDSAQKISVPIGTPLTRHYLDGFGLVNLDYTSAKSTWKLADLVALQMSPPQQPSQPKKVEECIFDRWAQPVVGTGKHPQGFKSYLHKVPISFHSTCHHHNRRMLYFGSQEPPRASSIANPLGDDGVRFSKWATETREEACKNLPSELSKSSRDAARRMMEGEARTPNPLDDALSSGDPNTLKKRLRVMLDEEVQRTRTYFVRLVVALVVVLLVICCLMLSPLVKWTRQDISVESIIDARGSSATWTRTYVAVVCACLIVSMLAVAWYGLRTQAEIEAGISSTRCAAARGVDEALNGELNSAGFLGLIPTLVEVQNLMDVLAENSTFWQSLDRLKYELDRFPLVLGELMELLDTLEAHTSIAPCSAIDRMVVKKARDKVEWGVTRTLELVLQEGDVLAAQGHQLVSELRKHLSGARSSVRQVKEFLLDQFKDLHEEDPLSYADDVHDVTHVGFIAIFALVTPMLLFSLVVICRLATDGGAGDGIRSDPDGGHQVVKVRRWAALCTWVTGMLYATVVLGISLWLQSSGQIAANACVIMDNLTEGRLRSYADTIGLPDHGPQLVQEASFRVVSECLGKDAKTRGDIGSLITLDTCPVGATEPVVESVATVLRSLHEELSERFESLRQTVGSRGSLRSDADIKKFIKVLGQSTVAELRESDMSRDADNGDNCTSSFVERCKVLRDTYVDLCKQGEIPNCDEKLSSMGCTDEWQLLHLSSVLSGMANIRVGDVDIAVAQASDTILKSVWGEIQEDLFPPLTKLVDSLDCRFLHRGLDAVVDGSCFRVTAGFFAVRDALFVLGVLCALMSVMMYVVWLRLTFAKSRLARALQIKSPLADVEDDGGIAQGTNLVVAEEAQALTECETPIPCTGEAALYDRGSSSEEEEAPCEARGDQARQRLLGDSSEPAGVPGAGLSMDEPDFRE